MEARNEYPEDMALFQPISLQDMCIQTILSSILCIAELYNVELNIPRMILRDIIEKGRFWIDFESSFSLENRDVFWDESLTLYERIRFNKWFSKQFIAWFFFDDDVIFLLHLKIAHITFVKHVIVQNNESNIYLKSCNKCLELWLRCQTDTTRTKCKIFRKFNHFLCYNERDTLSYMRNEDNWCEICKQSPLYFICDENSCCISFGNLIHECPRINHDHCYNNCYGGFVENFSFNCQI
ncbi:uncharacterized protein LOC118182899 [Stegodyphus dumicola]|uniref:uncharacterized protein LOC118182899 n=1 Tax=Stegodyphus dumicola TaxID=202533 RepID=UPI0015A91D79|nr:uncharacterized protein LOC118182899 [Stegodyphus dumicola]